MDVPDSNVERDGCYSDRSVQGFLSSCKQMLVYWTQRYITLHYITLHYSNAPLFCVIRTLLCLVHYACYGLAHFVLDIIIVTMGGEVWKCGVPRYVVLCVWYFLGVLHDCSDTHTMHDYLCVCVCLAVCVGGNRCATGVHTSLGHADAFVSFHSLDYFSLK